MGHIRLATPVIHIWHFRSTGSTIGKLLNMSYKELENIIYYTAYCVTSVDEDVRKNKKDELQAAMEKRIAEEEARHEKGIALDEEGIKNNENLSSAAAITRAKNKAAERAKTSEKRLKAKIQKEHESFEMFMNLIPGQLIKDLDLYRNLQQKYGQYFSAEIGAKYVEDALKQINLEELALSLREEIENSDGPKKLNAQKRLNVVNAFLTSGTRPEAMVLNVLPVLPPDLRPLPVVGGAKISFHDLTQLYRLVINCNVTLQKAQSIGQLDLTTNSIKRRLQEAVDSLIDNGRRTTAKGDSNRALKSLSDIFGGTKQKGKISFKSKNARFRANLLGKRVDYSGRSVIVVGPDLKMHQCGLPKQMALELFKPFVMNRILDLNLATTDRSAKEKIDHPDNEVWDILEEVIREHPVLLNRAPTLHRLGIQAFEPQLVEGDAIKLHPLVCAGFNADFDGDQMAVHVPLSVEAQAEARVLMLGSNNILKPSDGKTITEPSQDMIVGIYYLTRIYDQNNGKIDEKSLRVFASKDEAIMAKDLGQITINDLIRIRITDQNGESKLVVTSLGRVIFNEVLPDNYPFVNELVGKKELAAIIDELVAKKYSTSEITKTLDKMKEYGFKWSTWSGASIAFSDIMVAPKKKNIMEKAESDTVKVNEQFDNGLITEEERYSALVEIWAKATDDISDNMRQNFDDNAKSTLNNIVKSGARGNWMQIRQLAGMRGLVANTQGEIIARPIKSNYSEGLSVQEYFISSHGARKGVADTAFKTANAGYLTRRMVDVGYQTVVNEFDCETTKGVEYVFSDEDGKTKVSEAKKRIWGRYLSADVVAGSDVVAKAGDEITDELIELFAQKNITKASARSIYTCNCESGICAVCYGNSMATGRLVDVGEAVGVIAAQSIGEPGTQLTMRTFHTGGVASKGADLTTQGLPRLIQIVDAAKVDPKVKGIIAMTAGKVEIVMNPNREYGHELKLVPNDPKVKAMSWKTSRSQKLTVKHGDKVEAGDRLTEGDFNLQDVLDTRKKLGAALYIRDRIQEVFSAQGIDIHDKHLEIVINGMLSFVEIVDTGDIKWTRLRPVPIAQYKREVREAQEKGLNSGKSKPIVVGSRDVGFYVESWLSAAAFRSPVIALGNAAIEGKVDELNGLKENIIVGKKIPAGTGLPAYREPHTKAKDEFIQNFSNYDDFDYIDDEIDVL